MASDRSDLLQGTLDLLVLRILSPGPMHGWRISQRIEQISGEVLRVNRGRSTLLCTASNGRASSKRNGAWRRATARPASIR